MKRTLCLALAILIGDRAVAQAPVLLPVGARVRLQLSDSTVTGRFESLRTDTMFVSVYGDSIARIPRGQITTISTQGRQRPHFIRYAVGGAFVGYVVGFIQSSKQPYVPRCDAFGVCGPRKSRPEPFIGAAVGSVVGLTLAYVYPPRWVQVELANPR